MIELTISGNPPSKSNCYEIITIHGHGSLKKSSKLKYYEQLFAAQVKPAHRNQIKIDQWLDVSLTVYFKDNRQDLDNSAKIILDCLQTSGVIPNDRYVKKLTMIKEIDKQNPRVDIGIKYF